jgi:hypothetical protein
MAISPYVASRVAESIDRKGIRAELDKNASPIVKILLACKGARGFSTSWIQILLFQS